MNAIDHNTPPDYKSALEVLDVEMKRLGHDRVCPEGLIDLQEEADKYGWFSNTVRCAYYTAMRGFRELLLG